MKKYHYQNELEARQQAQQRLDELLFFQGMLLTSEALNDQFCGKAQEIAIGLQPWIDALHCRLSD